MIRVVLALLLLSVCSSYLIAEDSQVLQLEKSLSPLCEFVAGQSQEASLSLKGGVKGKPDLSFNLRFHRSANGDYEFAARQKSHGDDLFVLRRNAAQTELIVPEHKMKFVGTGDLTTTDTLVASGFLTRLVSQDTAASHYLPMVHAANPKAIASMVMSLALLKRSTVPLAGLWYLSGVKGSSIQFHNDSRLIRGIVNDLSFELDLSPITTAVRADDDDFETVELPRDELESTIMRGARRAIEILLPGESLTAPVAASRKTVHGELRWVEGQRVAILHGTPEEIGTAHGELLKQEALKTIESVLDTFGTVNAIRTGRWFRHDLEAAYARLAPHIPEDHKRETAALASAIGIEPELAQMLNVFPELFHCSGFAVFGSATTDGKLYHGRVLDYMTTIGLQDAATTFIVSVDGKISFANVGYAGFIGSVTGMNARAISLGEMGGGGEGSWDGVPMATLMRRALEECSTLQEVMDLWENNPRTCEYYYVFADGKTNAAVGVAALPESIEFIHPGQAHDRLGPGIPDTVVLSAGSRLETLRARVQEKHGQIDPDTALWLMSRPVAMESNLHNALFIPADGIVYVANASHKQPAAERPYVKLNLRELLESIPQSTIVAD